MTVPFDEWMLLRDFPGQILESVHVGWAVELGEVEKGVLAFVEPLPGQQLILINV
jgi:hypothetical protein